MEKSTLPDPNAHKKEEADKALTLIAYVINILVPIIAFAAALVLLDYGINQRWEVVLSLRDPIQIPALFFRIIPTRSFFDYLSSVLYFKAILLFFVMIWVILAGLVSMLNGFLYRKFGPSMYSSVDVPVSNLIPKK